MPGRRGLPGTPGYDGLLGQRGDKGIGDIRVGKSTKQFISYIFNCLFYLGVRGDDCGFCPPGTPGSKGDRGDDGKKIFVYRINCIQNKKQFLSARKIRSTRFSRIYRNQG